MRYPIHPPTPPVTTAVRRCPLLAHPGHMRCGPQKAMAMIIVIRKAIGTAATLWRSIAIAIMRMSELADWDSVGDGSGLGGRQPWGLLVPIPRHVVTM